MSRSRINGNFIDKTFTIVANILLRIIPTTSGEKEAFTYYRDGAIWFFFIYFCSQSCAKDTLFGIGIEKKFEINLRLLKVKFGNRTIPSVVYPRLMPPQILSMFQLSILVLSERLHLEVLYYNPTPLVPY